MTTVAERVRARILARHAAKARQAVPAAEEQVSYRELQAKAKELDIPANQSREDLQAAIGEKANTE